MFETQKLSRKLFQAKSIDRTGDRYLWQAKTVDRPVDRAFGQGACMFVHVVGQPLTLAVDQPVDRLKAPCSLFGTVDRPGRPIFYFFSLWPAGQSTEPVDRSQRFFSEW